MPPACFSGPHTKANRKSNIFNMLTIHIFTFVHFRLPLRLAWPGPAAAWTSWPSAADPQSRGTASSGQTSELQDSWNTNTPYSNEQNMPTRLFSLELIPTHRVPDHHKA